MEDVIARTIRDFCRAYGIGKSTTYKLIAQGKIDVRKAGSKTLIIEDSAKRWLSALPTDLPTDQSRIKGNNSERLRIKRQYHKSRKPKSSNDIESCGGR